MLLQEKGFWIYIAEENSCCPHIIIFISQHPVAYLMATHLQQYFPGYAYITTINTYLIVFITTTINTIDSGLDYCISNYRLQYILAQHSGYINSARSSQFINKPFRVVQFVTCTMYMNIYLKTAIIFIRIVFRFCGSSETGSNFAGSYSGFRLYKTKLCPKVNCNLNQPIHEQHSLDFL